MRDRLLSLYAKLQGGCGLHYFSIATAAIVMGFSLIATVVLGFEPIYVLFAAMGIILIVVNAAQLKQKRERKP
jgi:hypothetical protein